MERSAPDSADLAVLLERVTRDVIASARLGETDAAAMAKFAVGRLRAEAAASSGTGA